MLALVLALIEYHEYCRRLKFPQKAQKCQKKYSENPKRQDRL